MEDKDIWWHTSLIMQHCLLKNTVEEWTKSSIFPFNKKGGFWITRNCRRITSSATAAKVHNALIFNRIRPAVVKIFRKNLTGFWINRSTTSQILTIRRIIESVCIKHFEATLLFIDFFKVFNSRHGGKRVQMLLANSLPQETLSTIMIIYKNTKAMVR